MFNIDHAKKNLRTQNKKCLLCNNAKVGDVIVKYNC